MSCKKLTLKNLKITTAFRPLGKKTEKKKKRKEKIKLIITPFIDVIYIYICLAS